jgi:hypothetical protein
VDRIETHSDKPSKYVLGGCAARVGCLTVLLNVDWLERAVGGRRGWDASDDGSITRSGRGGRDLALGEGAEDGRVLSDIPLNDEDEDDRVDVAATTVVGQGHKTSLDPSFVVSSRSSFTVVFVDRLLVVLVAADAADGFTEAEEVG